jgi:phosphonatase-like hydrolase
VDLVVLDMAGTTIEDLDSVNRSFREALEVAGLALPAAAINEVMGLPKPDAIRILLERAGRLDLAPRRDAIHADFVARMVRFYREDPSVREVAGASECFRRLRRHGIKVALNTGFHRAVADAALARLGWTGSPLIDATAASDEVPRGRPHPDMIRRLQEELGVADARRVAKVGDTPADIEEGLSAGCGLVIAVTGGTHTREQLARPGVAILGSVAELPALLGL